MSSVDNKEKKAIEVVATAAGGLHAVKSAAKEAAHEVIRETASRAPRAKTRKSAKTRSRIMDAAWSLMLERGSMDFQMSEVSERCGMSKGSVYYYFSDREELVRAIFNQAFDEFARRLEDAAAQAPDALGALKAVGHEFARSCEGPGPLAVALGTQAAAFGGEATQAAGEPCVGRVRRIVASELERGKREGSIRADLDSDEAALFAVGGALLCVLDASRHGARASEASIDGMLEGALRGVGVQRAGVP